MENLAPALKSLLKKYFIIIITLAIASEIIARILEKRVLLSRLFSYPVIFIAIILFFIILVKSIKFAATNYLFKIDEKLRDKKIKRYFYLSFIYAILIILVGINFGVRGLKLISGIIFLLILNGWVIFRIKAGEIEK